MTHRLSRRAASLGLTLLVALALIGTLAGAAPASDSVRDWAAQSSIQA